MLIQPPHPPCHVKCPNSPAGTPSFCQIKMVLKPLFVQMEDKWTGLENGSTTVLAPSRERDYESAAQATAETEGGGEGASINHAYSCF